MEKQELNNILYKSVNPVEYAKELMKKGIPVKSASKVAKVMARRGKIGEKVDTYTKKGFETSNSVKADENGQPGWIVTTADKDGNPVTVDNEGHTNDYIMTNKDFEKTYKSLPNRENCFESMGEARSVIQIPEDIVFEAPWGGNMFLHKGD